MRQALARRYARIKRGEAPMPDLLLIDGGPGSCTRRIEVARRAWRCRVSSWSASPKARTAGPDRSAVLGRAGSCRLYLPPDSPALHLIQRIRDEAHRFAITGHRAVARQARGTSRCWRTSRASARSAARELLRQFGGLQGVRQASSRTSPRCTASAASSPSQIYRTHESGILTAAVRAMRLPIPIP